MSDFELNSIKKNFEDFYTELLKLNTKEIINDAGVKKLFDLDAKNYLHESILIRKKLDKYFYSIDLASEQGQELLKKYEIQDKNFLESDEFNKWDVQEKLFAIEQAKIFNDGIFNLEDYLAFTQKNNLPKDLFICMVLKDEIKNFSLDDLKKLDFNSWPSETQKNLIKDLDLNKISAKDLQNHEIYKNLPNDIKVEFSKKIFFSYEENRNQDDPDQQIDFKDFSFIDLVNIYESVSKKENGGVYAPKNFKTDNKAMNFIISAHKTYNESEIYSTYGIRYSFIRLYELKQKEILENGVKQDGYDYNNKTPDEKLYVLKNNIVPDKDLNWDVFNKAVENANDIDYSLAFGTLKRLVKNKDDLMLIAKNNYKIPKLNIAAFNALPKDMQTPDNFKFINYPALIDLKFKEIEKITFKDKTKIKYLEENLSIIKFLMKDYIKVAKNILLAGLDQKIKTKFDKEIKKMDTALSKKKKINFISKAWRAIKNLFMAIVSSKIRKLGVLSALELQINFDDLLDINKKLSPIPIRTENKNKQKNEIKK